MASVLRRRSKEPAPVEFEMDKSEEGGIDYGGDKLDMRAELDEAYKYVMDFHEHNPRAPDTYELVLSVRCLIFALRAQWAQLRGLSRIQEDTAQCVEDVRKLTIRVMETNRSEVGAIHERLDGVLDRLQLCSHRLDNFHKLARSSTETDDDDDKPPPPQQTRSPPPLKRSPYHVPPPERPNPKPATKRTLLPSIGA